MLLSSALPAEPLGLEPRQLLHPTSSPHLSSFPAPPPTPLGGLAMLEQLQASLPSRCVPILGSKLTEPMA